MDYNNDINIPFIGADNSVYVSTQQNGTFDNENFQLTSGDETLMLHGILCENGLYPPSESNIFCFSIIHRTGNFINSPMAQSK